MCVVQSASAALGLLFKRVQWWACSLSHFWWQGIGESVISLYSFHYISFNWTRIYFHETRVTLSLIKLTHWFLWDLIDVTLLDEKINLRSLSYRCWRQLWFWGIPWRQLGFSWQATSLGHQVGLLVTGCWLWWQGIGECDFFSIKNKCVLFFRIIWMIHSALICFLLP